MRNRILWSVVFCGLLASAGAQESAPPSFNRYSFNVGGGLGIGKGYVANFVGNSWQGTAGAGINFNRLFGVEAEYMIYDLKLRPSVSNEPGLAGSTGHLQAISLDGVVKVPRRLWKFGAYGIFGIGFDDRSVSVEHSQFLPNGTTCQQPYERWWGINCVSYNPQIPYGTVSGPTPPGGETLGSYSKVAGSYDYGGGITYKPESWRRAKIYLEYRHHHAYQSDAETIVQPISVGVRW